MNGRLGVAMVAALLSMTTVSRADTIPAFTVAIASQSSEGSWSTKLTPGGVDNGDGTYTYEGSADMGSSKNWADIGWDFDVDPDPVVAGVFSITNPFAVPNTYTVTFTAPVAPPVVPSSVTGGSVVGGLTDTSLLADGATLTVPAGGQLYMSIIDGVDWVPLLSGPATFLAPPAPQSGGIGPASFGVPIPSLPGPAALTSIGIRLSFTLSPGDSASFTSVFRVDPIPEPSTVVLMGIGIGGVLYAGYRRRAR